MINSKSSLVLINLQKRQNILLSKLIGCCYSSTASASAAASAKRKTSIPSTSTTSFNDDYFTLNSNNSNNILKKEPAPVRFSLLLKNYALLSKARLSTLVVLTSMAGYAVHPAVCFASPALLLKVSLGTMLCSCSANSINQLMEYKYDSRMYRTSTRPVVTGALTKKEALVFGLSTGLLGSLILLQSSSSLASFLLGAGNILLYTLVYTPLKRRSIHNTFVGAIVGGIPPLIGYYSVSSNDVITTTVTEPLLLFSLLFLWQYPHFNSLSYNIRKEYHRAGYKMAVNLAPRFNDLSSLAATIGLFGVTTALSIGDNSLCTQNFMYTSMVPNLGLLYWAIKFASSGGGTGSSSSSSGSQSSKDKARNAKGLFYASLFYLPAIILLIQTNRRTVVVVPTATATAAFDIKTVDWNLDIQRDRLRLRAIKDGINLNERAWLYYDQVQPWLLCSVIGVSIGMLVGFLHVCSVWLSDLKDGLCVDSWYLSRKFCCWESSLDQCEGWMQWSQVFSLQGGGSDFVDFCMYTLLSLAMASSAFYLVCNYSLYAMSSGLPEIRSILSGFTPLILTTSNEDVGEMMNMFVSLKTGMIKAIGACLAVGSGLSLGMELPLVHVAACLCTFFFSLFSSTTRKSRFSLDQGGSALLRREIMTAASASALAVALGAPIAGVLFSLEELSLTSSPSTRSPSELFSMAFYCCIVASAVLTHLMDPFRTGKLVMFHSTYLREYHVWELFIFALIGALFGGVFGFLFVRCSIFLAHTRRNGYFNSTTTTTAAAAAVENDNASWLDWLRWIPRVARRMMRRIDQWVNHDNERSSSNVAGDGFNDTASDTPLSPSRSADIREGGSNTPNDSSNENPQENIQRWWFPTDLMMKRSFQELFIVTLVTAMVSYSHPYLRDDMSYFLSGLLTECPQDKKVISPNAPTIIETWNSSSSSSSNTGILMQMHHGNIDWDSMLDKRDDIPTDSGDSSGSGRGHGSIGDDSDYFRLCSSMPANLIAMLIFTGTLRTVLTLVTFGLKIPSGVYLPSMLIGACFGRAVGMIVQALTPTSIVITPGTYALVGAASGLAGVSRLTVSVVVVMFEITGGGALNYIVPIMVALMSSRFVADGLDAFYFKKYSNAPVESRDKGMKFLQKYTGSITDAYMKFHGYPYLDLKKTWRFLRERDMFKFGRGDSAVLEKRVIYESVTALDVITKPKNQLYVIPAYKSSSTWKPYCHTVGSLKQFLSMFSNVSGYPVVETLENGIVIGYISKEEMLKFLAEYSTQSDLQKRCYFVPPEELAAYFEHENHISDVSRQVSPNRDLSSNNLTDSLANSEDPINPDSSNSAEDSPINILIDNAASLNFYQLMNISPVKIQPHYPTDLIVELFKKLGLRSLLVVKEGMAVYANTIPSSFDLVLISSSEQNEESTSIEGTASSVCSLKDRPLGSIMGIITRKDLLRAIERLEIGDHFVKSGKENDAVNGEESLSNITSPSMWNDFLTVPSQKRTSSPAVSFLSGINQNTRATGSKSETDVGSSNTNRRYREVGNRVTSTAPPDADSGDDMFLDAFGKPIQK